MNKQGGTLFDIFWLAMAFIGICVLLILALQFFNKTQEMSVEPACKASCEKYGYKFYRLDLGTYENDECWCLDDGKPRQVPIEYKNSSLIDKVNNLFGENG